MPARTAKKTSKKKAPASTKKASTKYKPGDQLTFLERPFGSSSAVDFEPTRIRTVVRCGKRDALMSDGSSWPIDARNVRPTVSTDAADIGVRRTRMGIGELRGEHLDREALEDVGPGLIRWREREARRNRRIKAALRARLIDGPVSDGDLRSVVTAHGCSWHSADHYIYDIGCTEAPGSKQYDRIYQRASTDEDRLDALIMGRFDKSGRVHLNEIVVNTRIGFSESEKDRIKRISDALNRCGAIERSDSFWELQPFDVRK